MKILQQFRNLIRENERSTKSPQKHDANLQKNSTLYFQVGLIVCLLATYGVLEMKSLKEPMKLSDEMAYKDPHDAVFYDIPSIIIEEPVQKENRMENKKIRPIIEDIIVTDNPIIEEPTLVTPESTPFIPKEEITVVEPEEPTEIDFIKVEKVPVFPGCENEKSNEALRKCFEVKMSNFISKKFKASIATDYGLSGKQKIFVEFKIDQSGNVSIVNTRAPHPALEKEAQGVINKLPQMKPGMQRDTPVSVKYLQPIVFEVN